MSRSHASSRAFRVLSRPVLVLVLASPPSALLACSGATAADPSNASPDSAVPDAGTDSSTDDGAVDANPPTDVDSAPDAPAPCSGGPLIPNLCPATAPSTLREACAQSHFLYAFIKLSSCGGHPVVIFGGAGATYCVYEDSGTHELAGSIVESDVSDYCDASSYIRENGTVPADCFDDANASATATTLGSCDDLGDATPDGPADASPDGS